MANWLIFLCCYSIQLGYGCKHICKQFGCPIKCFATVCCIIAHKIKTREITIK